MKYIQMLCLVMLINNSQAKIDIFSIASNFKPQDMAMPVTIVNPVSAVATVGLFGWKTMKSFSKFQELQHSRSNCDSQLIGLQKDLLELSQTKNEQIISLNQAHKRYLQSDTDNDWEKYFEEQTKLSSISTEIQKKEALVSPIKSEFTKLSIEIAEARASCMNNLLATVTSGTIVFGCGLWNLFGKQ